ncbi:MAG: hypothetical protein COV66_01945 [Nitrospinae bacterium CG11_big_fil_rev_8_21_14_0_20_45_15]|nr:MAG: hypothetical protein COV66_01945 [Nitrospinae bacterium CG11_big_fil_rev_8_21_14_0_20_45_15]
MTFLYSILITGVAFVLAPLVFLKMVLNSRFRRDVSTRLKGESIAPSMQDRIWIHSASVGEVRVAKILINALSADKKFPPAVLSAFTFSGQEFAQKTLEVPVFLLPLDLSLFVRPLLVRLRPRILVLIEGEFWPCLLRECLGFGIPIVLINGRMSEKAFSSYARFAWFFRWMTAGVKHFSMRGQEDADRILRLGIPVDRVSVMGNLKFDAVQTIRHQAGQRSTGTRVVFGSTRPGDEGPILSAIVELKKDFPDLCCVIAPRHVKRMNEVEELIRGYDLEFKLHSALDENEELPPLILVDQIGVLEHYYSLATLAFVGGGFNPRWGGQNILEPAAYGLPVVYGPHMDNFIEEARLLSASGGGIQIDRPKMLYSTLHDLLSDPEAMHRKGQASLAVVENNRGAVKKALECIEKWIEKK